MKLKRLAAVLLAGTMLFGATATVSAEEKVADACLWQSASGEQREADSLRIKESGEFEENGSALSDKKEISGGAL